MKHNYWIFDMDGTLTDSMGIWDEIPFRVLAMYGKEAHPGLREQVLPLTRAETARLMIAEYDLPLTEESFEQKCMEAIRELYRTVSLKPGVREMLARLKAEGCHLCICSNTWGFMCRTVLQDLGVLDCFDFILSAQDGYNKKEPEIFLECMRRMGAQRPDQCMVCEDAVHAVRTAKAAGFAIAGIADLYSRADEPEMRRLCDQFMEQWSALDWDLA